MANRTAILYIGLGAALGLYAFSRTSAGQSAIASVSQFVGDMLTPRGIRNNNPGNIQRNSIAWQGALPRATLEAAGRSWDATFVQFDTPANGVRALGHVLLSKAARGLTTVDSIIRDYSTTDQDVYVENVAAALGVDPGDAIDVSANLPTMAAAIVQQENGEQPYDPNDLQEWVYS